MKYDYQRMADIREWLKSLAVVLLMATASASIYVLTEHITAQPACVKNVTKG